MVLSGDYPDRLYYRPYVPQKLLKVINRCIAINRSERYSSAASFRKTVEGIEIYCDWFLRRYKKTLNYVTTIGNAKLKVTIDNHKDNKFNITTTKKVGDGQIRNINKDCFSDLTQSQLKKKIRQLLSRHVSTGK